LVATPKLLRLRQLSQPAPATEPPRSHLLWRLLVPVVFAAVSAEFLIEAIIEPRSIGSHASIYTAAARAWLNGGDPWSVGPRAAVFAGPPPMLLPFVPFTALPLDVTRLVWVVGSAVLAVMVIRRLRLPAYWIAFPPIAQVIHLGHPEVLLLALIVLGGPLGGLAPLVKPYFGPALLAERRWRAIALGMVVFVVTFPFLPWVAFVERLPEITATLARQSIGDSTFGQPIWMLVAILALASLGLRRGLWLAMPVLWPSAQPFYKVACVPAISPLLAVFWAIPIPGFSLAGLIVLAVADRYVAVRGGPDWLRAGVFARGLTRLSGDATHALSTEEAPTVDSRKTLAIPGPED
jgi:hypothetical protein